eukprot:331455-Prymnesium_polylepis.1
MFGATESVDTDRRLDTDRSRDGTFASDGARAFAELILLVSGTDGAVIPTVLARLLGIRTVGLAGPVTTLLCGNSSGDGSPRVISGPRARSSMPTQQRTALSHAA